MPRRVGAANAFYPENLVMMVAIYRARANRIGVEPSLSFDPEVRKPHDLPQRPAVTADGVRD